MTLPTSDLTFPLAFSTWNRIAIEVRDWYVADAARDEANKASDAAERDFVHPRLDRLGKLEATFLAAPVRTDADRVARAMMLGAVAAFDHTDPRRPVLAGGIDDELLGRTTAALVRELASMARASGQAPALALVDLGS